MRISREHETPLLLGVACALLTIAVLGEWMWKTARQSVLRAAIADQGTAAAVPPAQAAPKGFKLPPLERFGGIVERPLFVQGRRPAVLDEAAPAEPEKPFDAQLHGIAVGPDGVLVLLKDKAGHHHKMRQNETLDGWVLSEIGPDRVVMKRGESKRELLLQKPKPKEAAKAPAPASRPRNEDETPDEPSAKPR